MRFWDSSALAPLLFEQEATDEVRPLIEEDDQLAVWWGTQLECASAAGRLRRQGVLTVDDEEIALTLLSRLRDSWLEILPSMEVREEAMRLLRIHPIRAGDAFQLAAALVWSGRAREAELVTLDELLGQVARLEGLRVVPA